MRDLWNEISRPDEDVVFYDGFLYIISRDTDPYVDGCNLQPARYSVEVICLTAEYDEPWTLTKIAEKYPNVCKVIFDDALEGYVFNYGNHAYDKRQDIEMWERVGATRGYA